MAGTCECSNEPSGSIKWGNFLTSCKPVSFSRRTLLHGVSKSLSILLSSICFEQPSVHPQEDMYMQYYGIFLC